MKLFLRRTKYCRKLQYEIGEETYFRALHEIMTAFPQYRFLPSVLEFEMVLSTTRAQYKPHVIKEILSTFPELPQIKALTVKRKGSDWTPRIFPTFAIWNSQQFQMEMEIIRRIVRSAKPVRFKYDSDFSFSTLSGEPYFPNSPSVSYFFHLAKESGAKSISLPTSPESWQYIVDLPNLRTLEIGGGVSDMRRGVTTTGVPIPPEFPNLTALTYDATVFSPWFIRDVLVVSSFPSLHTLTIRTPTTWKVNFPSLLMNLGSLLSLRHFTFQCDAALEETNTPFLPYLGLTDQWGLLRCPAVEYIHISTARSFQIAISDNVLKIIAHNWPKLRHLHLETIGRRHPVISATLAGLIPLALGCKDLEYLSLGIDVVPTSNILTESLAMGLRDIQYDLGQRSSDSQTPFRSRVVHLDLGVPDFGIQPHYDLDDQVVACATYLRRLFRSVKVFKSSMLDFEPIPSQYKAATWKRVIEAYEKISEVVY